MKIQILELIDGAKKARGLTVIIDVFRAFSLECYLYDLGAELIRPIGTVEDAFAMREKYPGALLIGERRGKMCEGFDFGNSPSSVTREAITGKLILHTTSAGTQGIVNATQASEILTGSLVNARAVAEYIKKKNPSEVSLVCMGNNGTRRANEDVLCAKYIKSMLEDAPFSDMEKRAADLRYNGGEHFFDPDNQEVFPTPDFYLCTKVDIFPFVIRIERDAEGFVSRRLQMASGLDEERA